MAKDRTKSRTGKGRSKAGVPSKTVLQTHTKAMRDLRVAVTALSEKIDRHSEIVSAHVPIRAPAKTPAAIRQVLASCLGVSADDLDDNIKVSALGLGPGPVVNILMSRINSAFWPDYSKSLSYSQIKDLTVGLLVSLIQSKL